MQTIQNVECHEFQNDEAITKMLFWMGDDYLATLVDYLKTSFLKQDPHTEFVALKSEKRPEFESTLNEQTNQIIRMSVVFTLQFLVKDGKGQHWRLFGSSTWKATGLAGSKNEQNITSQFDLEKSERID